MALWTHLECVTGEIDRVLLSAPDTSWSREIISTVVKQFKQLMRINVMGFGLDVAFYTNDRYGVGLWCDGLRLHFGFDGYNFTDSSKNRAVFLINDSTVSLREYDALTNRIIKSALQNNQRHEKKLVSLNGNLVQPGITKYYWVESVYRGLTPSGVPIFYRHSCSPPAARACAGKVDNALKQCIVSRYEMSLADSFEPSDVDAMYPTYLPKEWDACAWEETGGRIGPTDQWIRGRRYFRYLHQVHDFPFRKLKWPRGQPQPPPSDCLKLVGDVRSLMRCPITC